jgi:glycosidase
MVNRFASLGLLCLMIIMSPKAGKVHGQPASKESIKGLASVIRMPSDEVIVPISDYYLLASTLDSISASAGYEASLKGPNIHLRTDAKTPPIGVLTCWKKGKRHDIPILKSHKQRVQLQVIFPKAQKVEVAGEMTNWAPQSLNQEQGGTWILDLQLAPGKYQYQIIVDGQWQLDPENVLTAPNGIGGTNSLLQVGEEKAPAKGFVELSCTKERLFAKSMRGASEPVVFWENMLLPAPTKPSEGFEIPAWSRLMARSHLRGWWSDELGGVHDFLIPLSEGEPIQSPELLTRQDPHANVLYFMLVDRFLNGNASNDDPLTDPEVHPKANYHGGDIRGITQKLKDGYFQQLGINTIWLSPITQNPLHAEVEYPAPHRKYSGYHGYWPISGTRIDHRFGTDAEMDEMVQLAHAQNINVILDYVSNHVHEEHPIYRAHPEWSAILDLPDGRKNIRIWDEHRLTTWFDLFLPDLDYSRPEVVETMADSALYMLQRFDLDGFRHDATKHIPEHFWRRLTLKIKTEVGKPIFQIGETFGTRELIQSYVGSGMMDGQFDFNLYFDLRQVLAQENSSFKKLDESIHSSLAYHGTVSLMGNITGNHDIPRFISYAGKGLKFDEDEKEAGWNRQIEVEDPNGYQRLKLLTAFLMTTPGIPVVYYGDEIGMAGAGDPDNRRPMRFEGLTPQELDVRKTTQDLVKLRRNSMSLMYGDFQTVHVSDHLYAYRRSYLQESTLVIFNKSAQSETLKLGGKSYRLNPYTFKIIQSKRP